MVVFILVPNVSSSEMEKTKQQLFLKDRVCNLRESSVKYQTDTHSHRQADRQIDGQTNRRTYEQRQTNGRTNERMNGRTDGQTDMQTASQTDRLCTLGLAGSRADGQIYGRASSLASCGTEGPTYRAIDRRTDRRTKGRKDRRTE